MLDWSLLSELYSLCILLILFVRYHIHEPRVVQTKRRNMFVRCLLSSMFYIILNVLCVVLLKHHQYIPIPINIALNTFYFWVSIVICSMYAYMLFDAMLEHVYDRHCMVRAAAVLFVITGLSTLLTVANLFTGWIFTIDEAGYHRGPFNGAYYIFLIAELFFLCVCYVRNRKSISDRMIQVIRSMPIIILSVCGVQLLYPKLLLGGTLCAVVSLVIFTAFRSNTENNDTLTGAQNRTAFMNELALRTDSGQSIQLIQSSILNISDINLRYTHTVGDDLLYEVSRYLHHCLPDIRVFRTGGVTFTVLLPYTEDEKADNNLSVIQSRLSSVWELGEIQCHLSVSFAEMRTKELSGKPAEITEKIEYTMSLAKKNPPLARFDDEVRAQFENRTNLVSYLRRAVDEDLFTVSYQPLYCCHKDIFCSAEALLRLNDSEGRPISPNVFVPLAEQCGLVEELTWKVFEDICDLFESNKYPGLQSVSVNLSMKQFLDPTLPAQIYEHLEERGVSADKIKVEITERFILHDAKYAKKQMETLRSLGIEVYMDDFGTGYSNLSSVLQYPFSFIKLDRSLISPILEAPHAPTMVGTLIKLFGDMNMRVVAEGVETLEQATLLRSLGIDMIQGFYYSKPTDSDGLAQYFDTL